MITPDKILFSDKYLRKDGRRVPLFKNKTALAAAIEELKDNEYANINSLKAMISQTMTHGFKSGHRSMPEKLQELIIKVSKNLIDESDPRYATFEIEFEESLANLKNKEFFSESVSSIDIEKERFERSEAATSHMIFTTSPAELVDNYKSEDLKRELKESLLNKSKTYRFFFDKIETAIRFWESIEDEIKDGIDWFELNDAQLKIYIIDLICCIHPMEILNYQDKNNRVAYIMHSHQKGNSFSISRISKESLDMWFENIYPHIISQTDNKFATKEIKYSDYLEHKNF